jgi:hypothetical protein
MTTQGVKRKLTAILSADVEGYSRLMGEDEESTVGEHTTQVLMERGFSPEEIKDLEGERVVFSP